MRRQTQSRNAWRRGAMSAKICYMLSRNFTQILVLIVLVYTITLLYAYNTSPYEITSETYSLEHDSYMRPKLKKYILQWTNKTKAPFKFMGQGNSAFVKNKCKFTNCYVTDNSDHLLEEYEFDAIAFNNRDVINLKPEDLPQNRTHRQKFIFGAMESADNFPVCDPMFDEYFNWTWTYKLDSNFRWGYITIFDLNGNIVGPELEMKWPERLKPIDDEVKERLSSKSKAAAWFVSHCKTKSGRENFVRDVQEELETFGWTVDVYGYCGTLNCSRSQWRTCFRLIEKEYYFYFSLENSFSEDYVTEKLLTPLNNYAVPVVYGAADYSRFLPPGSYLDGRELGPKALARRMSEIIGNKSLYHDFFRWRNHYVYKETSSTADICKLCEMMNDEEKVAQETVWKDFRSWWNGARYKANCG